MKNKVLVKIYSVEINKQYDVFIPVNDYILKVKKLILKCISDLNGEILDINKEYALINMNNGRVYKRNEIVKDTDIRNATVLVLYEIKM